MSASSPALVAPAQREYTPIPARAEQAAISLDRVRLVLGGRVVLREVTLSIAPGRFVGLLGPNGAGKTTLLRALLGTLRADAGRIEVLGHAPGKAARRIGYVPQLRAEAAHLHLSGFDYVASAALGAGWGLPWLGVAGKAEVSRVLALVDAEALAARPLVSLSGGERQRLLLAQALLGRPRLLLLDEPLLNLDPTRQDAVVSLVRRIQREERLTVLFSGHELNPLLPAMDEVLYLAGGRAAIGPLDEVVTTGSLSSLYGAPVDVYRHAGRIFVAGQGGAMHA